MKMLTGCDAKQNAQHYFCTYVFNFRQFVPSPKKMTHFELS